MRAGEIGRTIEHLLVLEEVHAYVCFAFFLMSYIVFRPSSRHRSLLGLALFALSIAVGHYFATHAHAEARILVATIQECLDECASKACIADCRLEDGKVVRYTLAPLSSVLWSGASGFGILLRWVWNRMAASADLSHVGSEPPQASR